MGDTTRIVRRNNNVLIDWTIQNWQPKTVVGMTVDQDPGAGFGTTAVAEAPDANTKPNGTGRFITVMPKLGTFVFTLKVKKKKADELSKTTVVVEELQYKSFQPSAPKVEVGKPVTLSWQLEAFEGCTFKLVAKGPTSSVELPAKVDAKGKGSAKFTPNEVGAHSLQLVSEDPTLQAGQTSPASALVQVEVKDHPQLKVKWSATFSVTGGKPTLKIVLAGTATASPPGFRVSPDTHPAVFATTGELKAAADNATSGDWEVLQEIPAESRSVGVSVFSSAAEAKTKGAKALAHQVFWFKAPAKALDAPELRSDAIPDRSGKLGTANMDAAKVSALSPKRQKMIRDFLPIVIPSTVGSSAFDNLMSKSAVDKQVAASKAEDPPKTFTTCGTVPSFLSGSKAYKEGVHKLRIGGLIGCYWAATDPAAFDAAKPAWVVAEAGKTPQAGDIFLIAGKAVTPDFIKNLVPKTNAKGVRTDAFETLHVGVIVDPAPGEVTAAGHPIIVVAEAGQGTQEEQKALYDRPILSANDQGFPTLEGRRLGGWVDLDNYKHWT